jgi:DNA-directed RNA polymerase specialized sigma24 family protein
MRRMSRQPGGDNSWSTILEHRPSDQRAAVMERFIENGIGPRLVDAALADMGDALCVAASSGGDTWADAFGGRLAVALLAAEVSALAAHLNSRASTVRAMAVDRLLDEYSAVTVAARLGVSRQKVYDIGRGGLGAPCTDRTAETIDRTTGESDG